MTTAYFAEELSAYAEAHGAMVIGVAGAGQMGTDLAVQIGLMPGLRLGAIADSRPGRAVGALKVSGRAEEDIAHVGSPAAVDAAIGSGKVAVVEDAGVLAESGRIAVIIDATGNPDLGALLALAAIDHGKPIVMLNVEADVTVGRFLARQARSAGVVYTGAAGDEPASALELIGFARSLGLEVVAAGKGKNNPLHPDAIPDDYVEEARTRKMNPRVLVEFVDGSKTAVEMVAIANATGLVPDIPGMHGPKASLEELPSVLCPRSDGGILGRKGVVDYSIGKGVAPGVFCIVEAGHPRLVERLVDLKVGDGPYFCLHRPFHLTSLEVPLSAARAVLYRKPDMVPLDRPVAEVVAVAKRDLAVGESLGRIGEADYRGWAMTWRDARRGGCLPLGLADKATVTAPIKAGETIDTRRCRPDEGLTITRLRRELDARDRLDFPEEGFGR